MRNTEMIALCDCTTDFLVRGKIGCFSSADLRYDGRAATYLSVRDLGLQVSAETFIPQKAKW